MEGIHEDVLANIDEGRLADAFVKFTSHCGHYASCPRGQANHGNCISTCLTPKIRHMTLVDPNEKWDKRIKLVEAELGNISQYEVKRFEMTNIYRIGHAKIDEDHRQIVQIVNELIDAYLAENLNLCDEKLKEFRDRLALHFVDENAIMVKLDYVDPHHDKLHSDIGQALDDLSGNYDTLAKWRACIEVLLDTFIVWILRHDLKFAAHLETIGYKDN
jgi:hemerythrin-like metal-binding protein